MCPMGEPVDKCGSEYWITEELVPSVKGQVGGDDCGFPTGPERKMCKEHLCPLLVERDITKFIANDQIIFLEAHLHLPQCPIRMGFPQLSQ